MSRPAGPRPCARAIFFSDVHLDPAEPEKTEEWLAFVDSLHGAGFERAFIVGDLFHFWVGPGHERLPHFRGAIDRLRALASSGCALTILHGNRDFHLGREIEGAIGAEVVEEAAAARVGGRAIYVAHGDLLLSRDTRYRAMRRVIRSAAVRRAFRALPLSVRLRVAGGMRGMSERSVEAKRARGGGRSLALAASAVGRVFRSGDWDAAVIGHVHRARRIALRAGGRRRLLFTLGAWERGAASWLEADARGWRLHDGPGGERLLEGTWEEAEEDA